MGFQAVFFLGVEAFLGLKTESNTMGDDRDRESELLAKLAGEGWPLR